ncbi:MAG TPA: thioredoxin [Candidatus Cloacimonadota bacterium]|nr:thioredoxin [Candidatus Cloacimonadota bacterium]HOV17143.1 thioredoxin [Candidatus Cloacimonadota bacterium]HQL15505.1 thioredoxin [Candidatus Cloacimonadota bacterium]
MALREFNQANFEAEVINSALPVLVDFWASWCGPCRAISPVVDKLAEEMEGKVKFGKVNVDEEPALASRYSIMSIPSLLIFKQGKVVEQIVGLTTIDKIREKLNSVL